jgi:hypothetical protein
MIQQAYCRDASCHRNARLQQAHAVLWVSPLPSRCDVSRSASTTAGCARVLQASCRGASCNCNARLLQAHAVLWASLLPSSSVGREYIWFYKGRVFKGTASVLHGASYNVNALSCSKPMQSCGSVRCPRW